VVASIIAEVTRILISKNVVYHDEDYVRGRRQDFFPGVGKLGGLETKVPQQSLGVEGWSPGGGLGAKSTEADKKFVKIMHK